MVVLTVGTVVTFTDRLLLVQSAFALRVFPDLAFLMLLDRRDPDCGLYFPVVRRHSDHAGALAKPLGESIPEEVGNALVSRLQSLPNCEEGSCMPLGL